MNSAIRYSGKAKSIPVGLAISTSVSMIVTVMFTAMIANFLNKETMTWGQAGYWIMGMIFIASFLGGKCAYYLIKRQRMVITVLNGLLYWGILLSISALFFGGNYEAIWETAGIIGAGAGSAAMLVLPGAKKHGKSYKRLLLS